MVELRKIVRESSGSMSIDREHGVRVYNSEHELLAQAQGSADWHIGCAEMHLRVARELKLEGK